MKKSANSRSWTLLCLFVLSFSFYSSAQSLDGAWTNKKANKWFKSKEWMIGLKLKPHKSISIQQFTEQYHKSKNWWDKAFEFMRTQDLETLKPGRYVIDEGNVTASVYEGPATEMNKIKWETHHNFNDIQFIIKGKALMGVVPLSEAIVTEAYDNKRDVTNYEVKEKFYFAEPGTFFIFSPVDIHKPGIKIEGFDTLKKILIKVRKQY